MSDKLKNVWKQVKCKLANESVASQVLKINKEVKSKANPTYQDLIQAYKDADKKNKKKCSKKE
tara:strand:+ start:319 stop:507 length:189 start_codon:yes stop_codon:yes gene_type:complete